jgi:hypothetical protein
MGENVRVRLENIRKMRFEKFSFVRVRNYITAVWVFDWKVSRFIFTDFFSLSPETTIFSR